MSRRAQAVKDSGAGKRQILAVSEQRAWRSGSEVRGLKSLTLVECLRSVGGVTLAVRLNGAPHDPGVPLVAADDVVELPWSSAPLTVVPRIIWTMMRQIRRSDLLFCDQPGLLGGISVVIASVTRKPIIVNVVGNPSESLGPRVVPGLRGTVARYVFTALQRFACRHATVTNYVTQSALQYPYPPRPGAPSFSSSDALPLGLAKPRPVPTGPWRLVTVGTLEQPYKGMAELIDAVSLLNSRGREVELTIVGTGVLEASLRRRAGASVRFAGYLFGEQLHRELRRNAAYVQASWTEGLPRALVEAMADGMPAVATNVGGVSELLERHRLVKTRDPEGLARAIETLFTDPDRWRASVRHNLSRSSDLFSDSASGRHALLNAVDRVAGGSRAKQGALSVIHVIGALDRGGAETVALDLCRSIPQESVRQHFLCLSGRDGDLAPAFREAGARVTSLGLSPVATFPVRLISLLRREKPDVVVSHVSLASGFVLACAALTGVHQRIARVHSDGDGRSRWRGPYRCVARVILAASATRVAAVSGSALDFAVRGVRWPRRKPTQVVINGVDTTRFFPVGARTGGDAHRPAVVVHIGRGAPEKNRAALPAIQEALAPLVDNVFRLYGSADAVDLGPHDPRRICNLGLTDDIAGVLRSADVLILPSLREGLPGSVLEALATGVPVVASDLPGLRELSGELLGITLVAPSAPPEQWARALAAAVVMPAEHRAEVARVVASSRFTLAESAQTWLSIWSGERSDGVLGR